MQVKKAIIVVLCFLVVGCSNKSNEIDTNIDNTVITDIEKFKTEYNNGDNSIMSILMIIIRLNIVVRLIFWIY